MSRVQSAFKNWSSYSKFFILPLLAAVYPAFFHYANNANLVQLSSLEKLLAFFIGCAAATYVLLLVLGRLQAAQAAVATLVFLLFFHTYGLVFYGLRALDLIQVEHYSLLPLVLLMAGYACWGAIRLKTRQALQIWNNLIVIFVVLIGFSLVKIIPIELRKIANETSKMGTPEAAPRQVADSSAPDIYYIIFDEMASFKAMREYWGYNGVDEFTDFLKTRGFYVAEDSRGTTSNTFYELASRLNYQSYPYDQVDFRKYWDVYFAAFDENRAMQYLKDRGYTIVVYDEGSPMTTKFKVDHLYQTSMNDILSWGSLFDDFGMLVLKNTMILPVAEASSGGDPAIRQHERMLHFTLEQAGSADVPSPKMVFIHLLIPHLPFLYTANGSPVDPKQFNDWDKYLGYYEFAMGYAEKMIDKILASADPTRPSVIVFQSDHGARNLDMGNNLRLSNYPGKYLTMIVNAWHLPGCDPSVLTQDMNPLNTFPIIFNCYFEAGIPLQK